MSNVKDIDQEKLKEARRLFLLFAADPEFNAHEDGAKIVKRELVGMGLNLEDDATYRLIDKDLTRQKLDDLEYLALTYMIMSCYHKAQSISGPENKGICAAVKHNTIEFLIEFMDDRKASLEEHLLPPDTDLYHREDFEKLLEDYQSKKLQGYCEGLAVPHAVESYIKLREMMERIKADLKSDLAPNWEWSAPLKKIKEIRELLDNMEPGRQAEFFKRSGADETVLTGLHQQIALAVVREKIEKEEGDFSDAFYKDALGELKAAGIDMDSDATYAALGTDRKKFWANHKSSEPRAAAQAELEIGQLVENEGIYCGQYKDRLGRIFNIFAAPEDLTDKEGHKVILTYDKTVKRMAELENWHGHDGTHYANSEKIIAALEDGSYTGGWFIPMRELMDGTDASGNEVQPDNIFAHREKERLAHSFTTVAEHGYNSPEWYWTSTERWFNRVDVYSLRFTDGFMDPVFKAAYQQSTRPVRLVPAGPETVPVNQKVLRPSQRL